MNNMNLPKGATRVHSCYGMGTVNINGLNVFTFKIRTKKGSLAHMALSYVLKQETELPLFGEPSISKKGQEFVVYRTACTEWALASKIKKAIDTATAYVLIHKADLKMGTKNAPPFVESFNRGSYVQPILIMDEEELPF
jgi:hypothetical protein